MKDKLNVFGEPDDIQQALYSSWSDAMDARCMVMELKARYHFNKELVGELNEVLEKLDKCSESVKNFAPNYHHETLEGWAQGAAEMSHP